MKYFLLLFFTTSMKLGMANDTLTVAEVYDFAVGDSFYYHQIKESPPIYIWETEKHIEENGWLTIITSIYYSAGSDTLFINGIPITNLTDYAVFHAYLHYNMCTDTTIATGIISHYQGRMENTITCAGGLESPYNEIAFVEGLGEVYNRFSGGNPTDGWYKTETWLVYYSKGTETWGTLPVGVETNNLSQGQFVSVYPTVNSGTFYIWKLTEQNNILQTGKLILNK